jgi:lysophospholipase L1-like esterase
MHNDGVSGQRSDEVLARFATTVLNHGYRRVIILCGTNDILQNVPNLTTELPANLKAMADIATSAGIEVVLSKLPPANNGTDLNPQVTAANNAIAQMAAQNGYLIVDYYTPLFGHPEDFIDGIHPNPAGYTIMEQALAAVVLH